MKAQSYYGCAIMIAFMLLPCGGAVAQTASLYGDLEMGPYPVGFQVKQTYDYTRGYGTQQARPIQIAIWYPAATHAPNVPFSTYLHLYLAEEQPESMTAQQKAANLEFWSGLFIQIGGPTVEADNIVNARTISVEAAPVAEGSFPVIVYGAGAQGEAFENSVLFEYLASYGYVVAASPSVGSHTHKMSVVPAGLEAQARDMEFIVGQLHDFPAADLNRLGLMGWSWGGLAAMLVQMRNPTVDAVLSLDGSISMHEDKIRHTAFFDLQRLRVPYAFMSAKATLAELTPFFNKVKYSSAYLLDFEAMRHGDFGSYGYIARNFASDLDVPAERKRLGYEVVCRYAHHFFDAYLKELGESKHFLQSEPKQQGIPDSMLTITFKESLPLPPSQETFFAMIQEDGVDQAKEIYDAVRVHDPNYKLFDAYEMLEYAYLLFDDWDRPEEALEALKLSLDTYPKYYQAYGHLGRLYEKNKDWKNALAYFSMAYGMALEQAQTADVQTNMNWYSRKIERLKERLGSGN